MIETGEIIEYDRYVGNYYGTPAAPLAEKVGQGKIVLCDITIEGSLAIEKKFDEDSVTIMLLPPSYSELEARLKYLEGDQKNGEQIQATYDKLKQDIKDGKISPEDAGKALSDKWIEISKKLQTDVSTQFVEQFIKENKNLENL